MSSTARAPTPGIPSQRSARSIAAAANADLLVPPGRSASPFGQNFTVGKTHPRAHVVEEIEIQALDKEVLQELAAIRTQNEKVREAAARLDDEVAQLRGANPSSGGVQSAAELSKLLGLYDERIHELEAGVSKYQNELRTVTTKYQESVATNRALQESVSQRVGQVAAELSGASQATAHEWQQKQEQLTLLAKENQLLHDQQRTQVREVEQLRTALAQKTRELCSAMTGQSDATDAVSVLRRDLQQVTEANQLLEKDLRTCMSDLSAFSTENERLVTDARRKEIELRTWGNKTQELRRSLDEVTTRFQDQTREATLVAARERDLVETLRNTEADLEALKAKHIQALRRVDESREENEQVYKKYRLVEERVRELEEQHVDAFRQQQRREERVQQAELEREKAAVVLQQSQAECERLQARLDTTLAKHHDQLESAVETVRSEWLSERKNLLEETYRLEQRNSELQSLADRAIREKRTAEQELQAVNGQLPAEMTRLGVVVDELTAKLRASERERIELQGVLESTRNQLHRAQNSKDTDKEDYAGRTAELHRRLRRAETALEEVKDEKVHLFTKLSDSERQLRALNERHDALVHQHAAEVEAVQNRHQEHTAEMQAQIKLATDAHQRACKELQHAAAEQRRATDRWRQDSKAIAQKYDAIVEELRVERDRAASELQETAAQLSRATAQRGELSHQLAEQKKTQTRLAVALDRADARADAQRKELTELLRRETELLQERKRLVRETDRLRASLQRAGSLGLSDVEVSNATHTQRVVQGSIQRIKQQLRASPSIESS